MKKFIAVLMVVTLLVILAVSASAVLYSPKYYGVLKVENGAVVVDGQVDEIYGDPICYYVQDGTDEPGDYKNTANWFFTKSDSDDCLFLVENPGNYAKGYAVWTDEALYVAFDVNIQGWNTEGVAPDGSDLWKQYCIQIGLFDYHNGSNIDLGINHGADGTTGQYCFVSNNGATLPAGMSNLKAATTRDGENVIYEVELAYDKVLSFVPQEGSCIGLDICVAFCDLLHDPAAQNYLTFVNKNYHERKIENARNLYFVTDKIDAENMYAAKVNEEETASDRHSVSLFGCNEAFGDFVLDTENQRAGFGCISLNIGKESVNPCYFVAPVNGTGFDTLEFEMYVSDLSIFDKFSGSGKNNGFEITSSGTWDSSEIAWKLADIKASNRGGQIQVGWNHIVLPLSTATATAGETGDFDISAINFMRIFMVGESEELGVTVKFDNMRLTDAQAQQDAEDQYAADKVIIRIQDMDEITESNYSSMKLKVRSVRSAYDKLSDGAKAKVPGEVLAILTAAESKIEEYTKANDGKKDEEKPDDGHPDDKPDDDGKSDDGKTDGDEKDPDTKGNQTTVIILVVVAVAVAVALTAVVVFLVVRKNKAQS